VVEVSELPAGGASPARSAAERGFVYQPDSFPVGVDIFVHTTAELQRLRAAGASFTRVLDAEYRELG
jgi:hypothetical protein